MLLASLAAASAPAGEERYDYDALGRLVRVIDEQGRITEYVYDPAGNILQVITGGSAQAPAITSYSPTSIRRGETKPVQIAGTGFNSSRIGLAHPGLDIANVVITPTQIDFSLTAAPTAALGTASISISSSAGTAAAAITVVPGLPSLAFGPQPVSLSPAGAPRTYTVSLSHADNIEHVVTVASANPSVATASPASLTFAPGELAKSVTVAPQAVGITAIELSSSTLASTSVAVFVSNPLAGETFQYAPVVGVVVESAPGTTNLGPFASPVLGIAKGAYITGVAPAGLMIGTGPTELVISGSELSGVTGVSVLPSTGLTLGAVSVAPDGRSVSVPVTVAADAPANERQVILAGAHGPYIAVPANADQFLVTLTPPQIVSIDPIFAVTGTTGATLTVRGSNLQRAQSITLTPSTGISVGAFPNVSADGTSLTAGFSVAALAPTGVRVVRVTTPGGTSEDIASPANSLLVANEVLATYRPIYGAPLGVVLQGAAPAIPQNAFGSLLGVAFGPTAAALAPAAASVGQTIDLAISGYQLEGVTSVQISPADGLTLGSPTVSQDGLTVTVSLAIASNAAQTLRTVKLLAGTTNIPFANQNAALFRVQP